MCSWRDIGIMTPVSLLHFQVTRRWIIFFLANVPAKVHCLTIGSKSTGPTNHELKELCQSKPFLLLKVLSLGICYSDGMLSKTLTHSEDSFSWWYILEDIVGFSFATESIEHICAIMQRDFVGKLTGSEMVESTMPIHFLECWRIYRQSKVNGESMFQIALEG